MNNLKAAILLLLLVILLGRLIYKIAFYESLIKTNKKSKTLTIINKVINMQVKTDIIISVFLALVFIFWFLIKNRREEYITLISTIIVCFIVFNKTFLNIKRPIYLKILALIFLFFFTKIVTLGIPILQQFLVINIEEFVILISSILVSFFMFGNFFRSKETLMFKIVSLLLVYIVCKILMIMFKYSTSF